MFHFATASKAAAVALLWLVSGVGLAGRPQYDPQAPEPIGKIGGSILITVEAFPPATVRERFLQLAGGEQARLVFLSCREPDEASEPPPSEAGIPACRDWLLQVGDRQAAIEWAPATAVLPPATRKSLREATGIWLEAPSLSQWGARSRAMLRAFLGELLQRGGVLAATAATGRQLGTVVLAGSASDRQGAPGLDLMPTSVIALDRAGAPVDDLAAFLATRPQLVGYALPERGGLWLRDRSLRALTDGGFAIQLAAGNRRPPERRSIVGRGRSDWIALSRAAAARAGQDFPADEPVPPHVERGTLILAGGGALPAEILRRFIDLAGGPQAPIVYVPCTAAESLPQEPSMVNLLRSYGARNVQWIHTKNRKTADQDESWLAPLRTAKGIWFGGGRQWNLVDSYQDTTAHALMHGVLERGGVIGGSSAGASIQAEYLARGDPLGNRNIVAEGYERGLGFLTGVAVDQHFSERGRQADMSALIQRYPQLLGIGLDEGTAIFVQTSIAEVVGGDGQVHFYNARRTREPGEKDHVSLSPGTLYELAERRLLD